MILDLWKRKTLEKKSHCYHDLIVYEKRRFQNAFRPQNAKPALLNSFGLKSAFEKLRFRDGFVWTVGPTVQIMLRFQIPLA